MAQAESNRVRLLMGKEGSWGETPSSPAVNEIPFVSETLKGDLNTVTSAIIRSDRMIDDQTKVGESASGGFETELKYADYNDILEVGMASTFAAQSVVGSSDVSFAAPGSGVQVITDGGSGFGSFLVGAWVRVKNASNAANNGVFEVTAQTSSTLTVRNPNGASEASSSATINQNNLRNGSTKQSLFIEKQFLDLTDVNIWYTGMRVASMNFGVTADQIVTFGASFLGKQAFSGASVAGTVTNASANQVMNATSNVGTLVEGGASLATAIQSATMEVNNNLRALRGVGSSGAIGINFGTIGVSGQIGVYFEDLTMYSKFLNQTQSSLSIPVTDPDGNSIVLSILNMKFSDGNPEAGGINQDVILPMDYNGLRNATHSAVFQIDSLAA